MNTISRLITFGAAIATLSFGMGACKKDSPETVRDMEIELPEITILQYGKTAEIALPAALREAADLSLTLKFDKTDNVELASNKKLHEVLQAAVQLDMQNQQIAINAALLYPNAAPSVRNATKIPESYTATLSAKTATGTTVAEQDFKIKVLPGKVTIENVNTSNNILFAYALYSDKIVEFKLIAEDIPTSTTTWYIQPPAGQKPVVSLSGSTIQFSPEAGDPAQKTEHTYDLKPMLVKDGFIIAETDFRVVFIPQIKFFFGMYYPDLNLTIKLNLLHIGLSNGYRSSAPTLYPEQYKSAFSLVSVNMDGKPFDNSAAIFSVDEDTGSVRVKKEDSLKAGSYTIWVKAITSTGLEYQTDLTLVMSAF
ncbi:hypothetical protein [Sphingobacterium paludis]|uniref:Uncharacterized protein n=1 Tax=Sphingobacterium paludis TaxID=1476465 RepID=A0A4R7CZ43_9SPHI|nr:hypothetical protein [Sphingobacterium paludis]TDS13172.1 hypothetical protein B0I21_105306 [Sphingobacterium paludis]